MNKRIFFIALSLLIIFGCSKTEQPDNSTPKLVWKMPLLNGFEAFSFCPVIYNDLVIYGSKYARIDRNEKPKIIAFNKKTGEKVWEWNDAQSSIENFSSFGEPYTFQNTLVVSTGARVHAIDMNTGKSIWTTKAPEWGSQRIVGVKNQIYHMVGKSDKSTATILKADISNGIWGSVKIFQKEDMLAFIDHYTFSHIESDGRAYIYFTAGYIDKDYTAAELHLMKLNTQNDSIVLDKIITKPRSGSIIAIDDKRVYLSGRIVVGYDKNTGETLKEYELPTLLNQPYSAGHGIVRGNKLFAPTSYPKFFCFDTESTTKLWEESGVSTSSPGRLVYHQGVVYYTSASDGFLHAIDENGKRFWKYKSPDKTEPGVGIFADPITIDEKENRVYVSTFFNAYCFETIKK
jgi:outer membrane protein assembly factor BamB